MECGSQGSRASSGTCSSSSLELEATRHVAVPSTSASGRAGGAAGEACLAPASSGRGCGYSQRGWRGRCNSLPPQAPPSQRVSRWKPAASEHPGPAHTPPPRAHGRRPACGCCRSKRGLFFFPPAFHTLINFQFLSWWTNFTVQRVKYRTF